MPLLFWLVVGHMVCDFPLQGQFLALGKNHRNPIAGFSWFYLLFAHAMIHAGMVALLTGNLFLALLELILHMFTDFLTCNGTIGFKTDQTIHLLCKILYVVLMFFKLA